MYRTRKATKAYNPEAKRKLHRSSAKACPFCQMKPDQLVYVGKTMVITKNIFPYQYWEFMDVLDHLLIVPKRHILGIGKFTDEEKIEAMQLFADYEAKGYNVYARADENNMKTVAHQHTHLIKTEGKLARASIFSRKPYFVWKT